MGNNLFLTGEIRVGKSTIVNKIIDKLNCSIGGYITERQEENGIRTFIIRSLCNYEDTYTIAKINMETFEKEIFIDNFRYHIPLMLDNSLKNKDLIILDELGFMENDIKPFTTKIYEILDSEKPVFGVLKAYDCQFIDTIGGRDDVKIIEITKDNRDNILYEIISILMALGVSFKD